MKKYLSILGALLMGAFVFTSCSEDEETVNTEKTDAVKWTVAVVNSGNQNQKIDGSLTCYNASTKEASQGVFAQVNGRSLGLTANDGVVYGSKLYLVVDNENTIEVVDASTMKSVRQISTVALLGEQEGVSPRHIVARDGKVYVDTYGGYVAAIDTATYTLVKKYKVGSFPEGMAFMEDTLFVANSDYGQGENASISGIDVTTGIIKNIVHPVIKNPTSLAVVGKELYVVDGDVYDPTTWEITSQGGLRVIHGNSAGSIMMGETAMGANLITAYNGKIYLVAEAYTAPKCMIFDPVAETLQTLPAEGLVSANGIAIDPQAKTLYILSYNKKEGEQWADYNAPGFCNCYDLEGKLLDSFATGVGPTAIVLNATVR